MPADLGPYRTTLSNRLVASPTMAAFLPRGFFLRTRRISSASSGTQPMMTFPSFPMDNGSSPRSSQAFLTGSANGIEVS